VLWPGIGMFEGEVDEANSSMFGDGIQAGQRLPMTLERADLKTDRALVAEMSFPIYCGRTRGRCSIPAC
jgi:hypothetical protein